MRAAGSYEQCIEVRELELMAHIGVPDDERAKPQRLTLSLTLWPTARFEELQDEIANAVDYAVVCGDVKDLVGRRADRLLETLAAAIAGHLLRGYPVHRVRVELRKYILSDARYTAVILVRERAEGS